MKRLIWFLKSSIFRWWFMIAAILTASSTCPCCGKSACPVGAGAAAIISAVMVTCARAVARAKSFFQKLLKKNLKMYLVSQSR